MTICEAGKELAQDGQPLRAQTIYALLRDGRLEGEKNPQGKWSVDAASVERYRLRRNLRRMAFRQALQDRVIDMPITAKLASPRATTESKAKLVKDT
jgi:hypothetical protein